ncbi:urease accessory protein [Pedococcus dokdonensis]|uniref:Urease accessory protein n=1 Tax=Pedococcus dokdonensis TaxID=443156 RepID=A0A1H0V2I0_9MICO|nr:urease accessory protein UreD [Pedococcus dokdonensis]SDP72574.1 urease accessory protein [Pedococcus dokdonensis]
MTTHTEVRTARVELWPDEGPGNRRSRLVLATGLVSPRVVRHEGAAAEVALVATTASLLGGDTMRLAVAVGPGLRLDLRDVAGTVAYHGRGLGCVVGATLRVHEGATLTWAGEPLVVADGSVVTRHLGAQVDDGGRLLLRDRVTLGRSGQAGGRLDCHTTLTHAGRPALVEHLEVRAGLGPGALGDARVVDTVTALGWRPEPVPGHPAYRLHAAGSVVRQLVREAHHSSLPRVWDAWRQDLPPL